MNFSYAFLHSPDTSDRAFKQLAKHFIVDDYVVVCVTRSHVCLTIICRWKVDSCL